VNAQKYCNLRWKVLFFSFGGGRIFALGNASYGCRNWLIHDHTKGNKMTRSALFAALLALALSACGQKEEEAPVEAPAVEAPAAEAPAAEAPAAPAEEAPAAEAPAAEAPAAEAPATEAK